MSERSRASESNEQAINELLAKLRARDEEIKVRMVHFNEVVLKLGSHDFQHFSFLHILRDNN